MTLHAFSRILFIMSNIGLRIRELREAKGWTQEDLASRARLRQASLSAMETGQTKGVDFATLDRIARVFEVEPGFLIVRLPDKKGKRL